MFTSQLPVPYTNLFTLFAGPSPTFSAAAISLQNGQPVYYQWFTNGVGIGGATSSNVTMANVRLDCSLIIVWRAICWAPQRAMFGLHRVMRTDQPVSAGGVVTASHRLLEAE